MPHLKVKSCDIPIIKREASSTTRAERAHNLAANRVYHHHMSPYSAVSSYLTLFTLTSHHK